MPISSQITDGASPPCGTRCPVDARLLPSGLLLAVTMADLNSSATRSGPTLLIVDDDAPLRRILEVILQRYGFVVLTAAAREAVEVYRANSESVSVVLLDGDASKTLAALRTLNPKVSCCFMTDCLGRFTEDELRALGVSHVFGKPFVSIRDLVDKLRRLGASASSTP
jgi:DNA-binding response OmpR family regulator